MQSIRHKADKKKPYKEQKPYRRLANGENDIWSSSSASYQGRRPPDGSGDDPLTQEEGGLSLIKLEKKTLMFSPTRNVYHDGKIYE